MIRNAFMGTVLLGLVLCNGSSAQQGNTEQEFRAGKTFLETKVYSQEEDQELIKKFDGLRVADVSDGLDKVGLQDTGLVNPEIHPLWKDPEHYTHRIIGVAVTARYVPTQKPLPGPLSNQEFDRWSGEFYNKYSSEPFASIVRPGSVIVIDEAEDSDIGSIGSNNIMSWVSQGCVGVVTDLSVRDTDEIITEKVPVYFRRPGRGIRPGRNEIESVNRPVVCGGVLVMPGDIVVADGDGVVVVPRAVAEDVAQYAHEVIEKDKAGRRDLYKKLNLPEDDSVK